MRLAPIYFQSGQDLKAVREGQKSPFEKPGYREWQFTSQGDVVRSWPGIGTKPDVQAIGAYENTSPPKDLITLAELLLENDALTLQKLQGVDLSTIDAFAPFKTKNGRGPLKVNFLKQLGALCSYAAALKKSVGEEEPLAQVAHLLLK